jgi:hypothetical protein
MPLLHLIRRKALDLGLWLLFVVCVLVMLKASSDASPTWAKGTWIQTLLAPFSTGNQIAFDMSVGVIVSLLVYVLVVRVPERKKRVRLKANLKRQYSNLKEDCIMNCLFACGGSADLDLVEQLKDREAFKHYFNESISSDQNRWHAVLNGMDELKVKAILQELSIFRRELEYTLASIEVDDPQVFAFLRGLNRVLHRSQAWSAGYDEIKPLSQFIWSIHTGWDWIHGYTGKDAIAEMIDAI